MATKKNKVISVKETKKGVSKKNIFTKFIGFLCTHKKAVLLTVICILIVLLSLLLGMFYLNKSKLNEKVITINNENYTRSDFMVYFYSVKYDYFGMENANASNENLKVVLDSENNITVGDYLKGLALTEIKTAAAIKQFAYDNNIELDQKDFDEIASEKQSFIKKLGGKNKFKKALKDNGTSEKSYDKMAQVDKLYGKILKKLYGEGKRYDLTEEELESAKKSYKNEYYKIEQVILTTIDMETRKSLSDTIINQKKTLINTIYSMAVDGAKFEDLIKKYSEDAEDKEPPYYVYYKKGELLTELEQAIEKLETNEISDVIQTKYAFHVIKKLELDDNKFDEYIDTLREAKALKALNDTLDDLKIIYHDAYKKI